MLMLLPFLVIGALPAAPPPAAAAPIILAQAPGAPETEEQRKKRIEEERKRRGAPPAQQQPPRPPQQPSVQPPSRPQPPAAQPQQPPPPRIEQRPAQQPSPPPQRREVQPPPRPTPPPAAQPRPQQPAIGQPAAPGTPTAPRREDAQPPPRQQPRIGQPPAPAPGTPSTAPRQDAQPPRQEPRIGQPPEQRRDPRQPQPQPQPRIGQPPPAPAPTPAPSPAPGASPPQQTSPPAASPARQDFGQDRRRIEELRTQRRERVEGGRTLIEEPDRRVIIREQGRTIIRHDETERFRRFGRDVRVEQGRAGEQVTIYRRPDGVQVVSVVDEHGRLIRRTRRWPDGREVVLIENTPRFRDQRVVIVDLPPPRISIPRERYIVESDRVSREELYETLIAPPIEHLDRRYTLDEVRYNYNLRARMRQIDLDTINFEFGSWEVTPDQVPRLDKIAYAIGEVIRRNPDEVFLIEGHTDAVGSDEDNLSLSDRRAESVANILSEHYQLPPENLTTQGYGEQHLKVPTQAPERQNRRVTVRRITPLLASAPR